MAQKDMAAWLADLRKRAYTDCRLHLVETTAGVIIIATALCLLADTRGLPTFNPPLVVLSIAFAAGAVWLAIGVPLLVKVREVVRQHAARVLTDGGLLYLAFEHQPSETLPSLGWLDKAAVRSANLQGGPSFRQRLTRLIRSYNACARSVGQLPLPPLVQRATSILTLGGSAVGLVVLLLIVVSALTVASPLYADFPLALRVVIFTVWPIYLPGATLRQAQRTGVMLAICDVLGGESSDAPAGA